MPFGIIFFFPLKLFVARNKCQQNPEMHSYLRIAEQIDKDYSDTDWNHNGRGHKADGVWASLRILLGKGPLTLANRKKAVSRMLTKTAKGLHSPRTGHGCSQSLREIHLSSSTDAQRLCCICDVYSLIDIFRRTIQC